MIMFAGMSAGVMMLTAFTTPEQNAKAKSSQIQMNDDDWLLYREGVNYCDGDNGTCMGRGDVYINRNTYQVKIRIDGIGFFDLTEYTGKDGYNYRFWYEGSRVKCYYYVYLNIRFN